MDTVAVGTRWDTAGVALPEIAPMPDRGALGAELWLHGHLCVDPARDPLVALVEERIGEARWLSAQMSRYDGRLAETYLRGAGELASRASGTDAERRAWGARSMLAELACGLRLPETTLARRLARTTMLAAFPQLLAAAESGRVSSWHCDVMLDVFTGIKDPDALARADAALIGKALTSTAPQLRAAARRWRARHVPRTEEQRAAAVADRRVELTPADEDMVWLSALIPAPAAVAIDRRLDAIAVAVAGPDDLRTAAQLRADAFVDLLLDASTASPAGPVTDERSRQEHPTVPAPAVATRAVPGTTSTVGQPVGADPDGEVLPSADRDPARLASALSGESTGCGPDAVPVPGWVRTIHAEVVLTVPVLSLLGHSDEPAELEGVGPIDIETARMLAANAPSFVRVLTHPESGAVLSVGRDRYRIPADLRRAVQVRDVTCRSPAATVGPAAATSTTPGPGPTAAPPRRATSPACAASIIASSTRWTGRSPRSPAGCWSGARPWAGRTAPNPGAAGLGRRRTSHQMRDRRRGRSHRAVTGVASDGGRAHRRASDRRRATRTNRPSEPRPPADAPGRAVTSRPRRHR